jgi:hypothetical protein
MEKVKINIITIHQQSKQIVSLKLCAELFFISIDTLRRYVNEYNLKIYNTKGKKSKNGKFMIRPYDVDVCFDKHLRVDKKALSTDIEDEENIEKSESKYEDQYENKIEDSISDFEDFI